MKKITCLILFLVATLFIQAQDQKPKLYNIDADARLEISRSVQQAKEEGKHVFIQVGGNW